MRFIAPALAFAVSLVASPVLVTVATAQTTPVRPMPKGTGLPPPEGGDAAVMAPLNALFAAMASGDAAALLKQVYPDGRVTAVGVLRGGAPSPRLLSWTQFSERIKPDTAFQESISDPAIEIDDDVAMVWAPFIVRVGGKVASCGYDHFDLIREGGTWKVMNLSFSSRITGCPGQ
jgi:hypothetical protein